MNTDDKIKIMNTVDGEAIPAGSGAATQRPQPSAAAAAKQPQPTAAAATVKPQVARQKPDRYIWGIYITFLLISVVELFSASSTEVSATNVYSPLIRHGIFLVLGLGLVLWLQKIPYIFFRKFALLFALVSFVLLIVSSYAGVEINGAQRAIHVAGMTIQPPEIAKIAIVLLLSSILSRNQTPGGVTNRGVFMSALVVVIFAAILWKNGLTNTILIMVVSISMFLIGGIEWKKLGIIFIVYGVAGGAIYLLKYTSFGSDSEAAEFDAVQTAQVDNGGAGSEGLQIEGNGGRASTHIGRFERYVRGVKPTDPIDDMNRQVILASFAQANGGLMGQGPGNSRESVRLPLAFSDYIFSIIVEDTGFVGGFLLLFLYLMLLARAGRIAYRCSRAFPAFLIMGCAVMIVFQALVHMAIVTGVFPVSGQPLPFISKGGTSILVMSMAIGMMLSVSRYAVTSGNKKEMHAELKELPEDMKAANFSEYSIEEQK